LAEIDLREDITGIPHKIGVGEFESLTKKISGDLKGTTTDGTGITPPVVQKVGGKDAPRGVFPPLSTVQRISILFMAALNGPPSVFHDLSCNVQEIN
jgi:hypothetical protein